MASSIWLYYSIIVRDAVLRSKLVVKWSALIQNFQWRTRTSDHVVEAMSVCGVRCADDSVEFNHHARQRVLVDSQHTLCDERLGPVPVAPFLRANRNHAFPANAVAVSGAPSYPGPSRAGRARVSGHIAWPRGSSGRTSGSRRCVQGLPKTAPVPRKDSMIPLLILRPRRPSATTRQTSASSLSCGPSS